MVGVDVSDAESMPGVKAVYHARGDDLGMPSFQGFPMMPPTLNRPIFANDVVRFVGDIVAAVVATSKAEAVDAADTVVVDYERLATGCHRGAGTDRRRSRSCFRSMVRTCASAPTMAPMSTRSRAPTPSPR